MSAWVEMCVDGELLLARFGSSHGRTELIMQVRTIADICRRGGWRSVLIDGMAIETFVDPVDRIMIASQFPQLWPTGVRLAVLGSPFQVLADKPFEHIASNRGSAVRVFTDRDKAMAWLRSAE